MRHLSQHLQSTHVLGLAMSDRCGASACSACATVGSLFGHCAGGGCKARQPVPFCALGPLVTQNWQASSRTSTSASPTPSATAGIDVAQERKQTIADIRHKLQGDLVAAAQAVDWSAEAGWALVNTLLLGECLCSAKGLQSCACDTSAQAGRALADTLLLGECCSCREAAEGPGRPVWPVVLTPGCDWMNMPPLGGCLCSKGFWLPVSTRHVSTRHLSTTPVGLAELCWALPVLWVLLLRQRCRKAIASACLRRILGSLQTSCSVEQGVCRAARQLEALDMRACRCQQQGLTAAMLLPAPSTLQPVSSTGLPACRAGVRAAGGHC